MVRATVDKVLSAFVNRYGNSFEWTHQTLAQLKYTHNMSWENKRTDDKGREVTDYCRWYPIPGDFNKHPEWISQIHDISIRKAGYTITMQYDRVTNKLYALVEIRGGVLWISESVFMQDLVYLFGCVSQLFDELLRSGKQTNFQHMTESQEALAEFMVFELRRYGKWSGKWTYPHSPVSEFDSKEAAISSCLRYLNCPYETDLKRKH